MTTRITVEESTTRVSTSEVGGLAVVATEGGVSSVASAPAVPVQVIEVDGSLIPGPPGPRGLPGGALESLADVEDVDFSLAAPVDGSLLQFDGAAGRWRAEVALRAAVMDGGNF